MPDIESIKKQLLAIEERFHAEGWDRHQPRPGKPVIIPQVRLLFDAGGGPDDKLALPPQMFDGGEDGAMLEGYVYGLAAAVQIGPPMSTMASIALTSMRHRAPGFYGLAIVHEAYMNSTPEDVEERCSNPKARKLADVPSSYEVRVVNGCDVSGNAYLVIRRRGREPEAWVAKTSGPNKLVGRIPESLAILAKLIADVAPAGQSLPDWLGGQG